MGEGEKECQKKGVQYLLHEHEVFDVIVKCRNRVVLKKTCACAHQQIGLSSEREKKKRVKEEMFKIEQIRGSIAKKLKVEKLKLKLN